MMLTNNPMPGSILRLKNFRHQFNSGNAWSESKARKGQVFVCILLGTEPEASPESNSEKYNKMAEDIGYRVMSDEEFLALNNPATPPAGGGADGPTYPDGRTDSEDPE